MSDEKKPQVDPPPPEPAKAEDGAPVNQTRPGPPPGNGPLPAAHVARRRDLSAQIFVPGSAARPAGLLAGADMSDDRVFTGDHATGKVRIYRRQATWRPEDGTSKYFNLLLNEIRRLRVKAGEPEFDN